MDAREDSAANVYLQVQNMNDCIITAFPKRNAIHDEYCNSPCQSSATTFICEVFKQIAADKQQQRNMCHLVSQFFYQSFPKFITKFAQLFEESAGECPESLSAVMIVYGQIIFKTYCAQCLTAPDPQPPGPGFTADNEVQRSLMSFGGGCLH